MNAIMPICTKAEEHADHCRKKADECRQRIDLLSESRDTYRNTIEDMERRKRNLDPPTIAAMNEATKAATVLREIKAEIRYVNDQFEDPSGNGDLAWSELYDNVRDARDECEGEVTLNRDQIDKLNADVAEARREIAFLDSKIEALQEEADRFDQIAQIVDEATRILRDIGAVSA